MVTGRDDVNGRITIPGSFNCFKTLLALSRIFSIYGTGPEGGPFCSVHILHSIYIFHAMDREMGGIQYCIGVWTCVPSLPCLFYTSHFIFWLSFVSFFATSHLPAEGNGQGKGEANRGGVPAKGNLLVNGTGAHQGHMGNTVYTIVAAGPGHCSQQLNTHAYLLSRFPLLLSLRSRAEQNKQAGSS